MFRSDVCKGRDCLIVGSAPNLNLESLSGCDGVVIGANGGAGIFKWSMGIDPDILCTTSYLIRDNQTWAERLTTLSLDGLSVVECWFDVRCLCWPGRVGGRLSSFGVGFEKLIAVGQSYHDQVMVCVVGEKSRVSTGVWAACFALYSGARSVQIQGVSLGPGHYGSVDIETRDHIQEDKRVLTQLRDKGVVLCRSLIEELST